MKRINIEKELKKEAERFTPDPLDKIKIQARTENLLPYESDRDSAIYNHGNTAVIAKNKSKTARLIAAAAIVLCLILILSFTLIINKNVNNPINPTRINLSHEDVYGMGAVSSVKLLGSNLSANAVKSLAAVNATTRTDTYGVKLASLTDDSEDAVKAQTEKFNEYFTALDSFLGEDVISTSTEANTDSRYPYDTKMTINGKDFNGETVTYVMYYTETLAHYDSDDDEIEYRLEGVMVIDGSDYYLEGERSEENEKDESETELKIRAYADKADKSAYIQMEQEYSVEKGETETEYVYSVYSDGKLLEQTAVEFEQESKNGKTETEYELEFRSGTSKGKYVVKREVVNNKTEIKVKYVIDGNSGEFRIREITDDNGNKHYEYTFSDNEKMTF